MKDKDRVRMLLFLIQGSWGRPRIHCSQAQRGPAIPSQEEEAEEIS